MRGGSAAISFQQIDASTHVLALPPVNPGEPSLEPLHLGRRRRSAHGPSERVLRMACHVRITLAEAWKGEPNETAGSPRKSEEGQGESERGRRDPLRRQEDGTEI